jgi:hypothetical protein
MGGITKYGFWVAQRFQRCDKVFPSVGALALGFDRQNF